MRSRTSRKSAATARASSFVSQRQPASGCDASVVSAMNARATSAAASRGCARREGSYAPASRASRRIARATATSSVCSSAERRHRAEGETRNARARFRVHRAKRAEHVSAPVSAIGEPPRSSPAAGAGSGAVAASAEEDSAEGVEATPRPVHGAWHGAAASAASAPRAPRPPRTRTRRATGAGPRRRPPLRVAASRNEWRRRRRKPKSESPKPMVCRKQAAEVAPRSVGGEWRLLRGRRRRHRASYSFRKCGFVNHETKSSAGDPRKCEVLSRTADLANGKVARESRNRPFARIICDYPNYCVLYAVVVV